VINPRNAIWNDLSNQPLADCHAADACPIGLVFITNLDPSSSVLASRYQWQVNLPAEIWDSFRDANS
jgi:hypothetical protein